MTKLQKFIENLAKQAGKILLKKFGKSKIVVKKSKTDFATDADLAAEKLIIREIKKNFPTHAIIAEESGYQGKSEFRWIIDPLDGTKNFHFGLPTWCVSIALQKNQETIIGVIYVPLFNELFSAQKTKGAKLNNKKIQVSKTSKITESLILVEAPRQSANGPKFNQDLTTFTQALKKIRRVRILGTAAYELALVARGSADGYLDFSRNTKIWDIAAGELLVREAGGKTLDTSITNAKFPNASILASNEKLQKTFQKILNI
jgi:myo-inositol-1(or 4)-monophosphatase